jgi:phosphatidylserine decarboxylase
LRIVPDGIYYASGLGVLGIALAYLVAWWAALPFYLLALFCLYFFRDPERTPPSDDVIIAPADGKVVAVRQVGPDETRISIFLNIFNVHVNRTPVAGKVSEVLYRKGKFLVASHEAASLENEQNTVVVQSKRGQVICRQIAGLIARRIVCYKRPGDLLAIGERIGYIKFGSRVDVLFGREWEVTVRVGERVSAGRTILARPSVEEQL